MKKREYITLDKLKVYQLARELSRIAWRTYQELDWRMKKINGDQYIESTDSVSANIAECYERFHYLDKVKFYYNARGSLLESRNWSNILDERNFLDKKNKEDYLKVYKQLRPGLNSLIGSVLKSRKNNP